jgi:hypothetical protein
MSEHGSVAFEEICEFCKRTLHLQFMSEHGSVALLVFGEMKRLLMKRIGGH